MTMDPTAGSAATERPPGDPFAGDGAMHELCRRLDWGSTPLGRPELWSATLRSTVRTCLDSPFPINLWCGSELVLIYNDAYCRLLGSKHPRALGRPGRMVWTEIWAAIEPMFEQIRSGGPPIHATDAPFVIERADGDGNGTAGEPNAWFTFSLSAVRDDAGEIVAFLNIVSESTDRVLAERALEAALEEAERAEARLRDVFEQAPSFLAVLRGADHVFEYANDAYYQLVGDRDLIGRTILEAMPELRGQGFEVLLDSVLESGEPYVGHEVPVRIERAAGEAGQRFVDFVYYPITETNGERSGVVAHGYDVTEHVRARHEAQRARGDAERANQAKGVFLANMSHEIRTPINAVMGYADLLDAEVAGELSARQHDFVQRIRASSEHLLRLVNDVLDFSKIDAGELVVRRRALSAAAIVSTTLEMVAPQAAARDVEVEVDVADPALSVLGDADRVRQVLLNLLSNAVKFTEPGGRITISVRRAESPPATLGLPRSGPWVVFTVTDTGSGIAPEQFPRIFDPFIQADEGHTRVAGGTGLGLSISRRLARLMDGELTAESRVGEGSRFSLWLAPAGDAASRIGRGSVAAPDSIAGYAPDAGAPAGLEGVGRMLLAAAEQLEAELVDRMRSDRRIGDGASFEDPQLANHLAAYLSTLAKSLVAIGSSDAALLEDSESIQDVMARHHGRQRRRLGWQREAVEREYELIREVLDPYLRRGVLREAGGDPDPLLDVVHDLIDRGEAESMRAFDAPDDE